jgi:hypothetical protein
MKIVKCILLFGILLNFFLNSLAQGDDKLASKGLIINQETDSRNGEGDDFTKKYLSADSTEVASNISETMDLALYRESFIISILDIKLGLKELIDNGYQKELIEKIGVQFDELLTAFEDINDGSFTDEVSKIEFVWKDFENYIQLPDNEKPAELEAIYDMWIEVNIDITKGFNKKFKGN